MDRNIESVDEFFNVKFSEYTRRLTHLVERYEPSTLKKRDLDLQELDDLLSILLELRSLFRNLQWYSEVNKRGFVKILKKLDKKVHIDTQSRYLNSKVLVLPFAHASSVNSQLKLINTFIDEITPLASEQALIDHIPLQSNTEKIINHDHSGDRKVDFSSISSKSSSTHTFSDVIITIRQLFPSDNSIRLEEILELETLDNSVLLSCLYKAITHKAFECIRILLRRIDSLNDISDLNGRNLFHRIIINQARQRSLGGSDTTPPDPIERSKSPNPSKFDNQYNQSLYISPAVPPASFTKYSTGFGKDGANSNDDEQLLSFILENVTQSVRLSLIAKDSFQKTPLHYSSQYGLKTITKVLVQHCFDWKLVDENSPFFGDDWKDCDGAIPIELAVKGSHPMTATVLLSFMKKEQINDTPYLLQVATRLGSEQLVRALLDFGVDVNKVDDKKTRETCLYTAAKLNSGNILKILLEAGADTELREAIYGWTPIFIAAVEGFADIFKILVDFGCDTNKVDGSGWNPREHACLRGHLGILDIVPTLETPNLFFGSIPLPNNTSSSPDSEPSSFLNPPSRPESPIVSLNIDSNDNSIKTFGHRYLENKSTVLINLGSMDIRDNSPPIQLDRVPDSKVSSTQLDTALSLIISAKNCEGEPIVIDLPLGDGQHLEQYSFYTSNPENMMVFFDLVPTYSGSKTKVLGRAVGLLNELISKVGENKTSLFRTITLPILETATLEVLGKIRFEFLIVNPFHHPNIGVAKSSTYWKSLTTTRVIGHRGLGKNSLSSKSLQLGENTLQSFIAAANLGASYVEFDVQLTKDFVPVIYHDFLVGETGIDIPMQSLTLEQFLNISEQQSNGKSSLKNRQHKLKKVEDDLSDTLRKRMSNEKQRAMSLYSTSDEFDDFTFNQRMRYTRDFKEKGFKANTRGISIQAPFTTLEEVLKTVPEHVGFNIECKYPMLDESQSEDMDNFAIELNFWVDTVLKTVYDHAKGRDIIFSSFHPEVCIMLSLKQPSIPVLFLTESGTAPMMDVRATSLQEAIRLARRWDLLGIVSECTPLIRCPRLVRAVKDSGIVCVTYGASNNDPVNARIQMKNGVDAVIVDSVLAVRKGLTEQPANLPPVFNEIQESIVEEPEPEPVDITSVS